MDVKINETSKAQKEIDVIVPLEKIEEYADKAAESISSQKVINGFRPGKAPRKIVEEKFGKEIVWQEACNEAIKNTYFKIIEENDFDIVSSPEIKVQSMEVNKPLSYKIIIDIFPEITLPDYKKIAKEIFKEKKEIKVEENEVDKTLEAVQSSRAKVMAVAREAQKGDEVIIDFQGSIDGVRQESLKAEKMAIILGEQKLIKGFEEQLIGLKAGETKTFSLEVEVPSGLPGKTEKKDVEFEVKVHSISQRELPEINDEFAKSLGRFSRLEDLRQKVRENIKLEKEQKEKERIRMKAAEAISDQVSADIPESMINKELDNMISEFKEKLSQSGLSFEEYLKRAKKSEQDFRDEWRISAQKRVLITLILQEIAKKENIEVKEEEVEQEANAYLSHFNKKKADLPDSEKLKLYIKNLLKNEKVFQLLEE